jgi:aminomethyltransferase
VDDLLVYKLAEEDYLLVINAGNTPKDVAWIADHARGGTSTSPDVSAACASSRSRDRWRRRSWRR